jgi:plasmid replication initiation protein
MIELEVSDRLRPYLIDVKNNFTSYRLQAVFSLSSKFDKRIYQICSQWKDIEETPKMTLHNFKVMLSLKDPAGKEPEQYEKILLLKSISSILPLRK